MAISRSERVAAAASFIGEHPELCPEGLGARQLALYVTGSIEADRANEGRESLSGPVTDVLTEWCRQSQGSG